MAAQTILLVEDELNDVLLIQRAFQKAGLTHRVEVLRDGEEVIAYFTAQAPYSSRERYPLPGLVLLDLKLLRMSGFEVLAWLRQQPGLKRLPIVVLTSSKERQDIDRAYEKGANSYLVKPSDFAVLVDMVKTIDLYWFTYSEKPEITPS